MNRFNNSEKNSIKGKFNLRRTIAVYATILLLWEVVAILIGNDLLFASPSESLRILISQAADISFWATIVYSLSRIFAGILITAISAIILAVLSFRISLVEYLMEPVISIIKSAPVASFIILFLILLTPGSISIAVVFVISFPVMYQNMLMGIKNVDKSMLEMARIFRLKGSDIIKHIYLPSIRPYFMTALSVAIGMGWKAGCTAEILAIPAGSIGERLYHAKIYLMTGELFAWTFVVIVASILMEKLLLLVIDFIYRGYRGVK